MFKFDLQRFALLFALASLVALTACDEDESDPEEDHEHGAIIRLQATFQDAADATAAPVVVNYEDEDGPGGNAPVADALTLQAGKSYSVTLAVFAEEEDHDDHDDHDHDEHAEEDITSEITEEADEHRIFFTGALIDNGTFTFTPADDLGLEGTLAVSGTAGDTGNLVITLKHYDDASDKPSTVDLTAGETDIEATFTTTLQ